MKIEADDFAKLKKQSKQRFEFHCIIMEVPGMMQEYKFHPTRRWRFDYYNPKTNTGYEYEGIAGHGKMRHTTMPGYTKDCEKYNEAGKLGIIVYRFTALNYKQVTNYL